MRYLVIVAAIVVGGCASAPMKQGQTYFVQWPGQPIDAVIVEQKLRGGFAICRSVKEMASWVCNFNMAIYYTIAVQPPATNLKAN
jgi:hypothetical protein